MQLIWMSGPTAKIVSISITRSRIAACLALMTLLLLILGAVFNWIGLRIAIDHSPEFAQRMGGLTSQSEFDKASQAYRQQIDEMHQQLVHITDQIDAFEKDKQSFFARLGIARLLPGASKSMPAPESSSAPTSPPVASAIWHGHQQLMDQFSGKLQALTFNFERMKAQWQLEISRIDRVPATLPLHTEFRMTSGVGFRIDPVTHLPSYHRGFDLVAPIGTPVHATANGTVQRSEMTVDFGQLVELLHADGFVTRYAHLNERKVQVGESLQSGDVIGWLGQTGKVTAPHLHYEVLYHSQAVEPMQALIAWSQRTSPSEPTHWVR
jgi:murein DD-endopeptidase MepM/ murein hydrolase activator NlpD